ncbi:DUF6090 family protein [Balneola sp. MJW-20]|uniref:DUF6090 family protein n=1 Tax=Gracilimonas aurantiaca TaxID=3234185 RepID=UPI003466541D
MITLFRRIREKLIASGSLTRYLLYAVGEILLVVVGILIALQVNNWNEQQASVNETKNHLIKKLNNLKEDMVKLEGLYSYRSTLHDECREMLDTGLDQAGSGEVARLITKVTVERRFTTSVNANQVSTSPDYFKNIEGTEIDELEQDYLTMIDLVTFSENRLNTFSENLEADLWRAGFFNDNRAFFQERDALEEQEFYSSDLPEFKLPANDELKVLEAILRRNEITSVSLSDLYSELMNINRNLQDTILQFLAES